MILVDWLIDWVIHFYVFQKKQTKEERKNSYFNLNLLCTRRWRENRKKKKNSLCLFPFRIHLSPFPLPSLMASHLGYPVSRTRSTPSHLPVALHSQYPSRPPFATHTSSPSMPSPRSNHRGVHSVWPSSMTFLRARWASSKRTLRLSAASKSPSSAARWSGRRRLSVGGSLPLSSGVISLREAAKVVKP